MESSVKQRILTLDGVKLRTVMDKYGRRWISLRDLNDLIGLETPNRIPPDDIIGPAVFEEGRLASLLVANIDRYFLRVDYTGPLQCKLKWMINQNWTAWFQGSEDEGLPENPLRTSYQHVLNEVLEPVAHEFMRIVELRYDRPLDRMELFDYLYSGFLGCIGNTSHVDYEDLSELEISHMISVMMQFSLMLKGYMADGYEYEFQDYPKAILIHLRKVYQGVAGTCDHWVDMLESRDIQFKAMEEGC